MDPIARMEFERSKIYPPPPYDPNFLPAFPESSEFPIESFTSLRLSNINPKIPDEEVREAVYQTFRKIGEFNIKFAHTVDRRLVYVNFAYEEDAQVARSMSLNRLELFDRPICVETVNHNKNWGTKSNYYPPPLPAPVPTPFPLTPVATGFRPFEPWDFQRKDMRHQELQDFPPRMGEETKPFIEMKHILPEEDRRATRTLFVANVDDKMDPEELKGFFDQFGIVEDIDVKCPVKGNGNPYAFVRFYNLDMAYDAKLGLSGKFLGKHQCKIGYARPVPTTCVWVGGLTEDAMKQDILAQFERFGMIVDFKWPKGKNYAYVAYDNVDSAQMAILELRGFPLAGTAKGLRTDFTELKQMEAPQPREPKHKKKHKHRTRSGSSSANEKKRKSKRGRCKHSKNSDTDDSSSSGSKKRRRKKRKVSSSRSESSVSDSDQDDSVDKKRSVFQIANIDAAETIVDLARCLPVIWSGPIELKNSAFYTQMHLVSGNGNLVDDLLSGLLSHDYPALKINQRLRLDRSKLKEVEKRINQSGIGGHCVLLAVSENNKDSNKYRPLTNLVSYLKQKNAAGVLSLPSMSRQGQEAGLLHTFPPCEFAHEYLLRCAPKLTSSYNNNDYIVIILVKVNL